MVKRNIKVVKGFLDSNSLSMHHNRSSANRLLHTVIVDNMLTRNILPPDFNAEGIRAVVSGPDHELIVLTIGCNCSVDGSIAFELSIGSALVNDKPLIGSAMEVKIPSTELEFSVAARHTSSFLILGDEAEGGFAC